VKDKETLHTIFAHHFSTKRKQVYQKNERKSIPLCAIHPRRHLYGI